MTVSPVINLRFPQHDFDRMEVCNVCEEGNELMMN